jgi:hypothetical protein
MDELLRFAALKNSLDAPNAAGDGTKVALTKSIEFIAANQSTNNPGVGTEKLNVVGEIYFQDGSSFGPVNISPSLPVGKYAIVKVNVPDKIPVKTLFAWKERIGGTTLKRAVFKDRDSAYIGSDWDAAGVFWYQTYVNGDYAEFANSGIVKTSN